MDIGTLQSQYAQGKLTPVAVVESVYQQIEALGLGPVWISLVPKAQAIAFAEQLQAADRTKLPLYGVPFAVKDNIDVEGMQTTAGCPAFASTAKATAFAVKRLQDAGAMLIGKTNMDQFATGLVGTRSPYGVPESVFGRGMISGGSSSGSAVAVARGLVSFALGTDTAGSGRVPAMLNNLVGLKPTRGLVSTTGVVPACRSLDCVSIFAETAGDAAAVFQVMQAHDPADPYARKADAALGAAPWAGCTSGTPAVRVGVLRPEDRQFFADAHNGAMYDGAIRAAETLGWVPVPIDIAPFLQTAALLYQGPWVAERYAAVGAFAEAHEAGMDPVVRGIVLSAKKYTATDAFRGAYELERLKKVAAPTWESLDVLLLPTAPRTYSVQEIQEAPVERNSHLGTYTNFVNLMDLAAVAVPAGMRPDGLPFGVSLIGPAGTDGALLLTADRVHRTLNQTLGGTDRKLADTRPMAAPVAPHGCQLMAVVGAHLSGQPLNWQLTQRGARLVRTCRTHPDYRLYALHGTVPAKPGLMWEPDFVGPGLEVEIWAIPTALAGSFVEGVPSPLVIGTVRLEDGAMVKGFLVEPAGLEGAVEITALGGWRNYLASLNKG